MSRRTRSRCQYYSAKPISKRMRSRCQDECKADVIIMRSRCQGECEADVNTNAKPMSRRPRSRCREGSHTRTRRMEVHTHTNKLTPNGNTQSDMFYLYLHWLLAFLLFLERNIGSPTKRASRSNVRPGCSKIIYVYTRKTQVLGGQKTISFWIGFWAVFGSTV